MSDRFKITMEPDFKSIHDTAAWSFNFDVWWPMSDVQIAGLKAAIKKYLEQNGLLLEKGSRPEQEPNNYARGGTE